MRFYELNENNVLLFAMKHYDNPQCKGYDEFEEDLNRIKYIKRLIRKYLTTGELRERLLLNHLVVFYNVFGVEAATRLLFYRLEPDHHAVLKTFLLYLNHVHDNMIVEGYVLSTIPLDQLVIDRLRELGNW